MRRCDGSETLLTESIKPRKLKAHLLEKLSERPPEALHYLGVSYGLTTELFNFWRKAQFVPLYVRQTPNDLTGEHTCIMVKVRVWGHGEAASAEAACRH